MTTLHDFHTVNVELIIISTSSSHALSGPDCVSLDEIVSFIVSRWSQLNLFSIDLFQFLLFNLIGMAASSFHLASS